MPTGVATGPLMATLFRLTASMVEAGSGVPCSSTRCAPASATSQTISAPLASTTRCMAADVSGPMPSPGTRATVCDAMFSPSAIVRTMPLCAAFWADATKRARKARRNAVR
ncbi:UNVERIFIED_ORG: hypothetical protein QOE_3451 [Clostridioides difficile F501]